MFESFVVMLREGVESALVLGILVTLLRRSGRRELMRPVWTGAALAAVASVGTAWLLKRELMPFPEQVYEGTLYLGLGGAGGHHDAVDQPQGAPAQVPDPGQGGAGPGRRGRDSASVW